MAGCHVRRFGQLHRATSQGRQTSRVSAEALAEAEGREKTNSSGKSHTSSAGINRKNTLNLATNATAPTSTEPPTTPSVRADHALSQPCILCFEPHDLDDCERYMRCSLEDRKKVLYDNRLCFACYGSISDRHKARTCKGKRVFKICNKLHPTGLHDFIQRRQPEVRSDATVLNNNYSVDTVQSTVQTCATSANAGTTAMSIVMVRLFDERNPQCGIIVYAALDSMSSACFVSRESMGEVGVSR